MLAIAYLALFIGFIGYPFRVAMFGWWLLGWVVLAKVDHATGSAGLGVLSLMLWWGVGMAVTVRAIHLEQTPWYRRNKSILENSHLAGVFLGGITAVAVSLLNDRLGARMNRSDALFLGVGYLVAFSVALIVNFVVAWRASRVAVADP